MKRIEVMLSKREHQILKLHSVGLTPDEIGDFLFISKETVRKTISNIKQKLNLQKATELTAFYWCSKFCVDFSEQRKQILSAVLMICLVVAGSFFDMRRTRRLASTSRRIEIKSPCKITA